MPKKALCLLSSSLFLWPVLLYFEEDSEKHIRRVPKFGFLINLCLVAYACSIGNDSVHSGDFESAASKFPKLFNL